MDAPPVECLRECFEYDPETGLFHWRARPEHHFPNPGMWRSWNRRFAGKRAFTTIAPNGYIVGRVSYDGCYAKTGAHRVAWALSRGRHSDKQIQHINRCRTDNRLSNLREVTQSENNWISDRSNGALPYGVTRNGQHRFAAGIWNHGEYSYLGTFDTPEEASAAWQAAAEATRGQFLRSA